MSFVINVDESVGAFDGGSFEPLPLGDYLIMATDVEEKASNAGNGYLKFTWEVAEGEYQGQWFFTNYNNKHPKADVQERAQREINSIARSLGIYSNMTSDQVIGKTFWAKVGIEKSKDPEFKDKNKIMKYYHEGDMPIHSRGEAAPAPLRAAQVVAPAARPAVVAAAGAARPWAKRA